MRPRLACQLLAVGTLAGAALAGCGGSTHARRSAAAAVQAHARREREPRTHATRDAAGASARIAFARVALSGSGGRSLVLPRGWHASVWAHVGDARLEAWTPQGALLVSSPGTGSVVELTPRRGEAPARRTILNGLTDPQGLAFDVLRRRTYLYVAESDEIDCYRWSAAGPTHHTITVPKLPDTQPAGDDVHRLKNVVVDSHHDLFVDIGSSSNASIPAPVPSSGTPRASVVEYAPSGRRRRVWATGVRNGDGLSFAPDGTLWTAVNERDQIAYPFHTGGPGYGEVTRSYVNDHPPDEVARLTPGRDLGWPFCDPDPDPHGGPLRYGDLTFTPDEQTNPGSEHLNCAKLAPLQRGLPAHSAPLGFHFLEGSKLPARWANGAVVVGHGSWDRQPPRPPVVYWLPWESGRTTLGPAITLVSGFQEPDGQRWGRTADAVPGPDGALYVSDDQSGEVDRIAP